ncbi:MAG: hypothetical protein ACRC8Y_25535, partial [Chroococcales cyanobacterium]
LTDTQFTRWLDRLIHPAPERRFATARAALKALHQPPKLPNPPVQSTEKVSPNYCVLSLIFLFFFVLPMYGIYTLFQPLNTPNNNRHSPTGMEYHP